MVADVSHADARGAIDHVVVRQDHAVRREDDARAGRLLLLVTERGVDVDQSGVDLVRDRVDVARARSARAPELPELLPPLPELPEPPKVPGDVRGNWKPLLPPPEKLLLADAAEGFWLPVFHAACPMPIPAASTTRATPPAIRPLRTLLSPLPPEALPAAGACQYGAWGSVGGPP